MKAAMLMLSLTPILVSSATVLAEDPASVHASCAYDKASMLELGQNEFDQDPNGGWRVLARNEACLSAAADLIRDYRTHHAIESSVLYWHEGQARAMAGDSEAAMSLMAESRVEDAQDLVGWNDYVAATIAFLQKDAAALDAARARLAGVERPSNLRLPVDQNGDTVEFSWPPNLDVVDRLIACFDDSYRVAYGSCSR